MGNSFRGAIPYNEFPFCFLFNLHFIFILKFRLIFVEVSNYKDFEYNESIVGIHL